MAVQKLQNPAIEPSADVLAQALGERAHAAYRQMLSVLPEQYAVEAGWNYYRDGKAWLCRFTHRQKTMFWLSVWDGFFRCSFHFTEKARVGVAALAIGPLLLQRFAATPMIGRLATLQLDIDDPAGLADFYPLLEYKLQLK